MKAILTYATTRLDSVEVAISTIPLKNVESKADAVEKMRECVIKHAEELTANGYTVDWELHGATCMLTAKSDGDVIGQRYGVTPIK